MPKKARECQICNVKSTRVCGMMCNHLACTECWHKWLVDKNHCFDGRCFHKLSDYLDNRLKIKQARRRVPRPDDWSECSNCAVKLPKPAVVTTKGPVEQHCPVCSARVLLEPVVLGFDASRCHKCGQPAQRIEGCASLWCIYGASFRDSFPVQVDAFEMPQ